MKSGGTAMRTIVDWLTDLTDFISLEHCRACVRTVRSYPGPKRQIKAICKLCWDILAAEIPPVEERDTTGGEPLKVVSAVCYEGSIKKLIYKLKYDGDLLLIRDLTELLMLAWERIPPTAGEVVLVPIPLHKARLKSRGFNQSELLAEELAYLTNQRVDPLALKRIKNTIAQHDLSKAQRLANLSGAFEGESNRLSGKAVILIDDICTSGATLSEAARQVRACGAAHVTALTVACARLY